MGHFFFVLTAKETENESFYDIISEHAGNLLIWLKLWLQQDFFP